jgi:hypothetical protein
MSYILGVKYYIFGFVPADITVSHSMILTIVLAGAFMFTNNEKSELYEISEISPGSRQELTLLFSFFSYLMFGKLSALSFPLRRKK